MGKKNDSKGTQKKKLTAKERKAQNHLKLMKGKKSNENTAETITEHENKKKAA